MNHAVPVCVHVVFVYMCNTHQRPTCLSICIMLGIFFPACNDIEFAHTVLAYSKRNSSAASPSSGPITESLQKVCVFITAVPKLCIQTYFKHFCTSLRTGGKMCKMCNKDYMREGGQVSATRERRAGKRGEAGRRQRGTREGEKSFSTMRIHIRTRA